MNFDWSDLAFASKKPIRELRATFIAAPRELSPARFKELVKTSLPQGNIILGVAKEDFVDGFEGQPQFRMLKFETVEKVINQVNRSKLPFKITTLAYFQRELPYIIEEIEFKKVIFVNGSWKHMFHNSEAYFRLVKKRIPFELVSPFVDKAEALDYEMEIAKQFVESNPSGKKVFNDLEMLRWAEDSAKFSFDYSHQTGVALGIRSGGDKARRFKLIARAFNKVVPYQAYILHNGSSRERHFSATQDTGHYDTIHAEVMLLLTVLYKKTDLAGTTLFINLLPCPSCSRMLSETEISEVVYSIDHSDGYGVKILEASGKKVKRVVP